MSAQLMAITREVSPSINRCELLFYPRQPIDVAKTIAQHKAYQDCLSDLGIRIVTFPAEPELPDAVFIEDAVVVVDEVAVMPIMGARSRRAEVHSLARARSLVFGRSHLCEPATVDGGDVLRVGRRIFTGLSRRTNSEGIAQLCEILGVFDYEVLPVGGYLINRALIDAEQFHGFELLDVPAEGACRSERFADHRCRNHSDSFPKTRILQQQGFRSRAINLSELQKAEAGVTCGSLIFKALVT